ncbi:MAG: phosphoribosylformylglycinamidine synthase subunit PurQ [Candidatus Eisenbacteria bacterium]|nr:phosphoribosylformylglycinamidine synthase subunit PurQ [Candidatus Eisenbacteria bacterium]
MAAIDNDPQRAPGANSGPGLAARAGKVAPRAVDPPVDAQTPAVRALVLGGYGLNCDLETEYAFRLAGASAERVHVNALIAGEKTLSDYHILALIGGFSWADDHGAGVILATKLRHHLGEDLLRFVADGKLVIGICNGFQALANLGLLPGFEAGAFRREIALVPNDCGNFRNQWVHLRAEESACVFTRGVMRIDLPVRHAEGKFFAEPRVLERLQANGQIALRYALSNGAPAERAFPWNPNGSLLDIAAISDPSGRIFGLMPHPEAYNHFTNHPDWMRLRAGARTACADAGASAGDARAEEGAGIIIFRNAVREARRALATRSTASASSSG